ncbi:MAG: tetratricopeptide repeat protein, partial [Acidobacteriota bacterium]|nr:tetratricopeptide repeat protein [Acidobacteriota bacterium]
SDNRAADSIEASRKALAIFPDYPEVFDNLGLCYQALAQPNEAKTSFEYSIALSEKAATHNEWPYLDYAAFLIKQESSEQSLPVLRRAIEINPNSSKAYYLQGRAFRKLDRKAEAKQSLEKAMVVDPNDSVVYYELGMLLNGMGETAEGRRILRRFQTLTKNKKP